MNASVRWHANHDHTSISSFGWKYVVYHIEPAIIHRRLRFRLWQKQIVDLYQPLLKPKKKEYRIVFVGTFIDFSVSITPKDTKRQNHIITFIFWFASRVKISNIEFKTVLVSYNQLDYIHSLCSMNLRSHCNYAHFKATLQ